MNDRNDRDLRRFAVKCARRVQHLMRDERSVKALDVAERYANGEATEVELRTARAAAYSAAQSAAGTTADAAACAAWSTARDAALVAAWDAADAARYAVRGAAWDDAWDATWAAEREEQLKLLAEFGNPFEEEER